MLANNFRKSLFTISPKRNLLLHSTASYSEKLHYGILFVPTQEAYVIERFGKFSRILDPGLNFCIPIIDSIAYIQVLKEIPMEIPNQSAITSDNVVLHLNGVLYVKIIDAYAASYGVHNVENAIMQLAQTTMRSEIGKIALDGVFKERETLNAKIVDAINNATESWGIKCLRYEIKDISIPEKIQISMQLQVEAERKKRAAILESEGLRTSEINKSEARKQKSVLESEGIKMENINKAAGESQALLLVAKAKAESIKIIAEAMSQTNGHNAVQMNIAEKYIGEFGKIAGTNNTLMMSSNINDVSAMVTQAMTIYKSLNTNNTPPSSLPDLTTSNLDDREDINEYTHTDQK